MNIKNKNKLIKIERKKVEPSYTPDYRAFQWDGSDKDLGSIKLFQTPTILAKKLKCDGILLDNENFLNRINKNDYVVIRFITYKGVTDMYCQVISQKNFKKDYKVVE